MYTHTHTQKHHHFILLYRPPAPPPLADTHRHTHTLLKDCLYDRHCCPTLGCTADHVLYQTWFSMLAFQSNKITNLSTSMSRITPIRLHPL
ncbi:unnamed protein product [Arctogadus glacialis]